MFGKKEEPEIKEVTTPLITFTFHHTLTFFEGPWPTSTIRRRSHEQHSQNVGFKPRFDGCFCLDCSPIDLPNYLGHHPFLLVGYATSCLLTFTNLTRSTGFAYGLLDVLNAKFQTALNITAAKAGGLQGAYFGAYFIGPLTYSGWIVRKFGYRWTFIVGLCIYGVGALMFWPSAVYRSFPGFCGSLFIVGSGLSTLETSANPFIATCGPPRLSEFRLELSQSFQAVGSVMAPLLASRVFFSHTDPTDLSKVQWTYLGIAAFVFLLAIVFFFSPLPEVTDADMALQAEQCSGLTGYV